MKLLEAPVKPEHPIDFIRDNLGPTIAEKLRVEGLEQQLADYKKEVSDLKSQIEELKVKLDEINKPMINGNIDINKPDEQSVSSPKELVQAIEPFIQNEQVKNDGAENTGVDTVAVSVPTNTSNIATAVNDEKIDCNAKVEEKVPSEESKDSNAIALAENAEVAAEKIETKN